MARGMLSNPSRLLWLSNNRKPSDRRRLFSIFAALKKKTVPKDESDSSPPSPFPTATSSTTSYISLGRYEPDSKETGQLGIQNLTAIFQFLMKKRDDFTMDDALTRIEALLTLARHYHQAKDLEKAATYYNKACIEAEEVARVKSLYLNDLYTNDDKRKQLIISIMVG